MFGGIPNLHVMSYLDESPFCTLRIIHTLSPLLYPSSFYLGKPWLWITCLNSTCLSEQFNYLILFQLVYKHIGNTNNQLLWKPPQAINHVIKNTCINWMWDLQSYLLIYLENCISEISNFDFVINVEINVGIQLWGTEKLFAIAINSL